MNSFPEFMRNPANRIAPDSQHTGGIEGYVFDGADGSQMAFWTHPDSISVLKSAEHVHNYDEYVVVVQRKYTLIMGRKRITLGVGEKCLIPKGTLHKGEAVGGTRTIHALYNGESMDSQPEDHPRLMPAEDQPKTVPGWLADGNVQ